MKLWKIILCSMPIALVILIANMTFNGLNYNNVKREIAPFFHE